jgi:hypothetical protein
MTTKVLLNHTSCLLDSIKYVHKNKWQVIAKDGYGCNLLWFGHGMNNLWSVLTQTVFFFFFFLFLYSSDRKHNSRWDGGYGPRIGGAAWWPNKHMWQSIRHHGKRSCGSDLIECLFAACSMHVYVERPLQKKKKVHVGWPSSPTRARTISSRTISLLPRAFYCSSFSPIVPSSAHLDHWSGCRRPPSPPTTPAGRTCPPLTSSPVTVPRAPLTLWAHARTPKKGLGM